MFKRIQRVNKTFDKRARRGELVEDEGPRELALDEDTDSDDSESQASSSASSASESDLDSDAGSRARSDDEGEKSQSDDAVLSDESTSSRTVHISVDPILKPSIQKALAEPIYVQSDAVEVNGSKHRSCYVCPLALLKTQKMVDTHIGSGSHARRLKRVQAAIEKLTERDRREPSEGGLDFVTVVDRVDEAVLQRQERDLKRKQDEQAERKALKVKEKASRVERKAAAAAVVAAAAVSKKEQHGDVYTKRPSSADMSEKTEKKKHKRVKKAHKATLS